MIKQTSVEASADALTGNYLEVSFSVVESTYHTAHATGAARSMGVVIKRDRSRCEVRTSQLAKTCGRFWMTPTCQRMYTERAIAKMQHDQVAAAMIVMTMLV